MPSAASAEPGRAAARDVREIVGGVLVALTGLAFLVPSFDYGIGTLRAMEAGLFPMGTSVITIAIGLGIVLDGIRRRDPDAPSETVSWRPMLAVTAAIAVFALVAPRFGLLPGVVAAAVVSSLGDSNSRLLGTLVLAAVLALLVWLIFSVGLAMPIPAVRF